MPGRILLFQLALILVLLFKTSFASPLPIRGKGHVTFTPTEAKEALLHNPDMGWVIYENYPLDTGKGSPTLMGCGEYTYPLVDAVGIMAAWSDIEKAPGVYDFSRMDYAYDYWHSRGKEIQLRLSSCSLLWWPHSGKGVPKYVLDELPAKAKQYREWAGPGYWVVDARHPFYKKRLKAWLEAVAEHYSGTSRPVTLVDLRGYGVWGEGHSGFQYESLKARREALEGLVDLWYNAFKHFRLVANYSHDPTGPTEYYAGSLHQYEPFNTLFFKGYLHYSALDYALKKPNVTLRRDGVAGAINSNERLLINSEFSKLQKGPFISEFCYGWREYKSGITGFSPEEALADALSLHPNYVNVPGWHGGGAKGFLEERPDLAAEGLRKMGYRLVPLELTCPDPLPAAGPWVLQSRWVNRAVGRALVDFQLRLRLRDETGAGVVLDVGVLPTSKWVKGHDYFSALQVVSPGLKEGAFTLALQLVDPRTGKPLALPLKGELLGKWYEIGKVEVSKQATPPAADARLLALPGGFKQLSPLDWYTQQPLEPTLRWEKSSGADYYEVVLSSNPDLSAPLFERRVQGTSVKVKGLLAPHTTYYWQVTAFNDAGSRLAWKTPFSFRTGWGKGKVLAKVDFAPKSEGLFVLPEAKADVRLVEKAPGKFVLLADTRNSKEEWHNILWLPPEKLHLAPGGWYSVTLRYRVLDKGKERYPFATDFRSNSGGPGFDEGLPRTWTDTPGEHERTIYAHLRECKDYGFLFIIHGKAAVELESLVLREY